MRKLVGVISSLLLVAGIPASAADLPPLKPVPPVPLYDWNGFYVGAGFAYHSGRTDDVFTNRAFVYPITRDTFHGSFGSIDAGYCRMAVSPVVLCGEAAVDLGRARGTSYAFTSSLQNTAIRATSTIDWMVTVGPKLGVAIDANQLFIYASMAVPPSRISAWMRPPPSSARSAPAVHRERRPVGTWAQAWNGCSRPVARRQVRLPSRRVQGTGYARSPVGPRSAPAESWTTCSAPASTITSTPATRCTDTRTANLGR